MPKKIEFSAGNHKKQTPMEPVYRLDADIKTVIMQIIEDLKMKENEKMRGVYGMPWKEINWCSGKMVGDNLQLLVTSFEGGLRCIKPINSVLAEKAHDYEKILEKFDKIVKKEYKERTGKTLSWKNPKVKSDYEMIHQNGVFRFFATKIGEVKNNLPGQSFDGDGE